MGCFPVIEVWATALDVSPDHVTIADFQAALPSQFVGFIHDRFA
jgi:hypothetical protein